MMTDWPDDIPMPEAVREWYAEEWQSVGNGNYVLKLADAAIAALKKILGEYSLNDRMKTAEINILTPENISLQDRAKKAEARIAEHITSAKQLRAHLAAQAKRAEKAEAERDYYEMRLNEEMAEKQILRREKEQAEGKVAHAIEARDKSEAWAVAECKARRVAEAEVIFERKRGDEYLAKWGDALKTVARLRELEHEHISQIQQAKAEVRALNKLLTNAVKEEAGAVNWMERHDFPMPEAELPAIAEADAIIPLNDEQAEAFKALSESIKSEQRLEAELRDEPKGEVFWTHGWRKRAEKAEAELESIKKRSGDWTVTERKLEVERSLRRKMAERLKRYEDGLGAKDHFLIRAQQAEAQLDALLEANANNGLELMDEVGKRKLAEAELAKAPTWATVEALQEQLKQAEAELAKTVAAHNDIFNQWEKESDDAAQLNWMVEKLIARHITRLTGFPAQPREIAKEKTDLAARWEKNK